MSLQDADARAAAIATAAIARGAGAPFGIVAGQAWEGEPGVPIEKYHRLKTAAPFEAAVVAGAVAGGGQPEAWRRFGAALGAAIRP